MADYKIKSDVQIEQNLTVEGDLTVQGTTTSVESATLDVTDSNITVNNGGDQASADTNDAGLTVEMSDATDAIIHYDSTSPTKWKVGEVGTVDNVVGDNTTQAVTNKTFTSNTFDASLNTLSNVDLASQVTGTLPVANGGTGQTTQTGSFDALAPTTTKGDTIVHNGTDNVRLAVGTDGQALIADSTQTEGVKWGSASGGAGVGGINYLAGDDFNFENTTGNWATYDDGASATPVDGTLGSPSAITISQNTTTPQIGAGELRISKAASDGQGEGTSVDLTVEEAFKSSVNKIEFYYRLSTPGDFVTGADSSVQVFLYDVTGAALIPLSNEDIIGQSGKFRATFVGTGNTSLRLIFHVTDTVATAWAMDVDNVVVGPSEDVKGLAGSATQETTITFDALTTAPTKGTVVTDRFIWWRVGEYMHFNLNYEQSAPGADGSGDYLVDLTTMTGLSIDTAFYTVSVNNENTVGHGIVSNSATAIGITTATANVVVHDANNLGIAFHDSGGSLQYDRVQSASLGRLGTAVALYALQGKVKISGWSTDVSMANGSTFRMSNILANGTRVTADPTKLGEYRSQLRDANAVTYSDTNGTPTDLPDAANGLRIYDGNAFTAIDTSNEPTRYKIFVGKKKHIKWEFYASAGMTGFVDMTPFTNASNDAGYLTNYDPTTGIAEIIGYRFQSGAADHQGGHNGAGGFITHPYFDIIVSENALAVGTEAPRSMVRMDTGNGHGSTNTRIRRFTNITSQQGSAITVTQSATDGDSFTINEDGVYSIGYSDMRSAGDAIMGISLNSSQLTTSIASIAVADRLHLVFSVGANNYGHCSATVILSKGDVIRAHTDGNQNAAVDLVQFTITQVSK